jgi:hypothetical protein
MALQAFSTAWKQAGAAEKERGDSIDSFHDGFQARGRALVALVGWMAQPGSIDWAACPASAAGAAPAPGTEAAAGRPGPDPSMVLDFTNRAVSHLEREVGKVGGVARADALAQTLAAIAGAAVAWPPNRRRDVVKLASCLLYNAAVVRYKAGTTDAAAVLLDTACGVWEAYLAQSVPSWDPTGAGVCAALDAAQLCAKLALLLACGGPVAVAAAPRALLWHLVSVLLSPMSSSGPPSGFSATVLPPTPPLLLLQLCGEAGAGSATAPPSPFTLGALAALGMPPPLATLNLPCLMWAAHCLAPKAAPGPGASGSTGTAAAAAAAAVTTGVQRLCNAALCLLAGHPILALDGLEGQWTLPCPPVSPELRGAVAAVAGSTTAASQLLSSRVRALVCCAVGEAWEHGPGDWRRALTLYRKGNLVLKEVGRGGPAPTSGSGCPGASPTSPPVTDLSAVLAAATAVMECSRGKPLQAAALLALEVPALPVGPGEAGGRGGAAREGSGGGGSGGWQGAVPGVELSRARATAAAPSAVPAAAPPRRGRGKAASGSSVGEEAGGAGGQAQGEVDNGGGQAVDEEEVPLGRLEAVPAVRPGCGPSARRRGLAPMIDAASATSATTSVATSVSVTPPGATEAQPGPAKGRARASKAAAEPPVVPPSKLRSLGPVPSEEAPVEGLSPTPGLSASSSVGAGAWSMGGTARPPAPPLTMPSM